MIHHGDLFDVLPTLAEASMDACVTDPPYGIGFMGKKWDTFAPSAGQSRIVPNAQIDSSNPNLNGRARGPASSPSAVEYDRSVSGQREFQAWSEAWARLVWVTLKPGAHLLVCGAPRSYHRMASGLEDAGFEIRDCLAWLFGQGFPKSLNFDDGWGTALKPAYEPIVLARKPFKGSVGKNREQFGTGAINVDRCRIGSESRPLVVSDRRDGNVTYGDGLHGSRNIGATDLGRWPSNVALDEEAAAMLDTQSGHSVSIASIRARSGAAKFTGKYNNGERYENVADRFGGVNDSGGASRFFYVAKPSRAERDAGCYGLEAKTAAELTGRKPGSAGLQNPRAGIRAGSMDRDINARVARNIHPTVKPVELMRWLVRLVTPDNGIVLDPFTGSGTTGMACAYEGVPFIGIEREAEYVEIATRRIASCLPLLNGGAAC